jgi:hypothetical protein
MLHSFALTAYTDTSSGTPVTLVVAPEQAAPGQTTPGHTAPPPHHLPFTGFDLVHVVTLAAVLLVVGSLLALRFRRPVPARVRRTGSHTPPSDC